MYVSETHTVGYNVIAYNQTVYGKLDPTTYINPFRRQQQRPHPPFPKLDPRVCCKCSVQASPLTQLSRLTVVLDKDNLIKSGTGFVTANSNALLQYDLLSVMPLTDMAFQHACITLSELKPFSVDIITLDLAASPRLPFHLKRSTVGAALANGVVFEITYGDALDPSREVRDVPTARRNLFSNARDLLRVTNGKGVIFSSGALAAMSLRAPYDVMNLYVSTAKLMSRATLMGMTPTSAKDTLSATCRSLLIRARTYYLADSRNATNIPRCRVAALGGARREGR